jgi:flavin-binding protein dodecin
VTAPRDGQVDKVIRVVATSGTSWEDAARAGVAEGAKTITDLMTARVTESDIVITDGSIVRYRVKLEMSFQLDRSRLVADTHDTVRVRRYLVVANQTLASPALHELVEERVSIGPSEFHILVPEPPSPSVVGDITTGIVGVAAEEHARQRLLGLQEAEDRLDDFRRAFRHLGGAISGEVGLGDPVSSARRVLERSSFDEIIVSTLAPGVSRWLKLDLPNRLQRSFSIPVITLVQDA